MLSLNLGAQAIGIRGPRDHRLGKAKTQTDSASSFEITPQAGGNPI